MHLFVKMNKIADYDDVYKALGKKDTESLDEFAVKLGFDDFSSMVDDWDNDPTNIETNDELYVTLVSLGFDGFVDDGNGGFVLWDIPGFEARIKSADLVTYDNSGNIIPLSERFNLDNEDIRYSDRGNADSDRYNKVVDSTDEAIANLVSFFSGGGTVDAKIKGELKSYLKQIAVVEKDDRISKAYALNEKGDVIGLGESIDVKDFLEKYQFKKG